jgi:hypothetical protein
MIDEKKRIDIEKHKALVYILNGGKIGDEAEAGIPGIDFPAGEGDIGWLRK